MKKIHINRNRGNTHLKINTSYVAEPMEVKLRKITEQKTPIVGNVPPIYTERKDGVNPAYDIRTDRFDIAVEAMSAKHKQNIAKRRSNQKPEDAGDGNGAGDGAGDPSGAERNGA